MRPPLPGPHPQDLTVSLAVVVGCIAGGKALRMKKQQRPEVNKGLLITMWVVVGLSFCVGVAAAVFG